MSVVADDQSRTCFMGILPGFSKGKNLSKNLHRYILTLRPRVRSLCRLDQAWQVATYSTGKLSSRTVFQEFSCRDPSQLSHLFYFRLVHFLFQWLSGSRVVLCIGNLPWPGGTRETGEHAVNHILSSLNMLCGFCGASNHIFHFRGESGSCLLQAWWPSHNNRRECSAWTSASQLFSQDFWRKEGRSAGYFPFSESVREIGDRDQWFPINAGKQRFVLHLY